MAARPQQSGDGFAAHISSMSKSQLYDLMCQVKVMIEQNQNQARQVLIDNPILTRTLFQAQIMLGMVQPPKVMPNIQQVTSQPEAPKPIKPEPEPAPPVPTSVLPPQQPSTSIPSLNLQTQPLPAHPNPLTQQPPSLQQPQKTGNFLPVPPVPSAVPPQFNLPSHFAMPPGGNFNQPPLQPPMSQQPRMQVPPMQQQFSNPMVMMPNSGIGFQAGAGSGPGPQQMMPPQHSFLLSGMPSSSFPQVQPPLPSQPPPQQIYQGAASHMNVEYGSRSGIAIPSDRVGPWGAAGHPEMSSARPQMQGPPPFMSNQIGQPMAGQASQPPSLTQEMHKALLEQVRSLTPEQINMLPPDQRQQVLQLQDMLR
ncbi:hypothetical protein LUZ63_004171 [Rhynchospora breviuscula]|uniref:Uncharacterized protein n=1 Tax=Rhynchospora breviuscula TaxID=2022672 RepID=A0A9Q0D3F8_9POAL|nr:hypothetical protein LUZ63_004171 [Rhynchospora breviuscula]